MKYKIVRNDNKEIVKVTSIYEFLLCLPNFISEKDKIFPSKVVIQHVLKKCSYDSGMSGLIIWEDTDYLESEIKELDKEFSNSSYICPDYPDWVIDVSSWQIWKMEYLYNIPSEKHKKLAEIAEKCNNLYKLELTKNGESNLTEELFLKKVNAESKLADFIQSYF